MTEENQLVRIYYMLAVKTKGSFLYLTHSPMEVAFNGPRSYSAKRDEAYQMSKQNARYYQRPDETLIQVTQV